MPRRRVKGRHRAPRTLTARSTSRHTVVFLVAASTVLLTNTGATTPVHGHASSDRPGTSEGTVAQASSSTPRRAELQRQASRSGHRGPEAVEERRSEAQRAEQRREARAHAAAHRARERRKAARAWVTPLRRMRFTSGFGYRWGRLHAGADFAVPVGTPVRAMSSGRVTAVRDTYASGHRVEIRYWDGTVSYYFHLTSTAVQKGQRVSPGEVVAHSGNTGRSTGPHLHLEIHPKGGKPINPLPWLAGHGLPH